MVSSYLLRRRIDVVCFSRDSRCFALLSRSLCVWWISWNLNTSVSRFHSWQTLQHSSLTHASHLRCDNSQCSDCFRADHLCVTSRPARGDSRYLRHVARDCPQHSRHVHLTHWWRVKFCDVTSAPKMTHDEWRDVMLDCGWSQLEEETWWSLPLDRRWVRWLTSFSNISCTSVQLSLENLGL